MAGAKWTVEMRCFESRLVVQPQDCSSSSRRHQHLQCPIWNEVDVLCSLDLLQAGSEATEEIHPSMQMI